MLIDMIHDLHAEPGLRTRSHDPALLRAMGYEAIVIPGALAALSAPPASRDQSPDPTAAS